MTDDPRQILVEGGVDMVTFDLVGKWYSQWNQTAPPTAYWREANDAIIALSRLVAKYKWQRDDAVREWRAWDEDQGTSYTRLQAHDEYVAELERRWSDRK